MLLLAEWDEVSFLTFENFKLAIMLLVYEVWINLCSVFSSLDKVSAIGGFESPVSTHLLSLGVKFRYTCLIEHCYSSEYGWQKQLFYAKCRRSLRFDSPMRIKGSSPCRACL